MAQIELYPAERVMDGENMVMGEKEGGRNWEIWIDIALCIKCEKLTRFHYIV